LYCFSDGVFGNAIVPFFNDGFPGHPAGDLVQNVCHEDTGPSEDGLSVADVGVCDDVATDELFSHIDDSL
jgi:hypothetical protein